MQQSLPFAPRDESWEALREREERYRWSFEQAPIGIAHLGPDGSFESVNPEFCRILGYDEKEIVGRPADSFTPPEDLPIGRTALESLREGARDAVSIEKRYQRKDGSLIWARLRVSAVRGPDRGLRFALGVIEDVTERRRADLALSESEQRFRTLAEALPDIVWTARPDGTIDYYNGRFESVTGRDASRALARGWEWVLHPDDEALVRAGWGRAVASGEPYQIEHRIRSSDGSYRWYVSRAIPVRDEAGAVVKWFGTATDIHDQKVAQQERERLLDSERAARGEAERQSRLKEDFLASLSHELRTPLNAILGWSQILKRMERWSQEEIAEAIEVIERNALLQKELIEDLLDMSRIVSGKIRLSLRPVSVLELCAESIASIRPTAEAKGIEIESRIDPDAAGTFQADAPRLQQVLWNLLSNAVKFTPAGGKVALRVERREETVCFEVQDDGIGIAAEFLPFVFERFRQSDASTTRKHRGLGLGLAIVKNLVELHGGTIHAESAGIGAGSLFVVTIPARAGETAPPADPPAPASAPAFREEVLPVEEHPLRGVRVMAIDDEPESLALLRRILEDAGAEVTTASSAQQAETILEETRPDVLVSDIGMPGEDGYSLIRRIRATQGELARIPALALTAFARVEDRHRSLESGFQKHLSKPFSAAEVIAAVAALARAARLEEGEREGEDPRGR